MDKVCLGETAIHHLFGESKHEGVARTPIAISCVKSLQLVGWEPDNVRMTIAVQLHTIRYTIPCNFVNMIRADAQTTSVLFEETKLMKANADQAYFAVLLGRICRVYKRALHATVVGWEPPCQPKN